MGQVINGQRQVVLAFFLLVVIIAALGIDLQDLAVGLDLHLSFLAVDEALDFVNAVTFLFDLGNFETGEFGGESGEHFLWQLFRDDGTMRRLGQGFRPEQSVPLEVTWTNTPAITAMDGVVLLHEGRVWGLRGW